MDGLQTSGWLIGIWKRSSTETEILEEFSVVRKSPGFLKKKKIKSTHDGTRKNEIIAVLCTHYTKKENSFFFFNSSKYLLCRNFLLCAKCTPLKA